MTVLRFEAEFPQRFQWALGGALPGLYCASGFRVSFCWREGGHGHVVLQQPGCRPAVARLMDGQPSPSWGFSAGTRHSLCMELRHIMTERAASGATPCGWNIRAWVDDRLVVQQHAEPSTAPTPHVSQPSTAVIELPQYGHSPPPPSTRAHVSQLHQAGSVAERLIGVTCIGSSPGNGNAA